MSDRIAEFDLVDDALMFRNIKGKDAYTVCGGIHKPWAVIAKRHYLYSFDPFEPPEARAAEEWANEDDHE